MTKREADNVLLRAMGGRVERPEEVNAPSIVAECWTCGKGSPAMLYVRSDIYMHRGCGHDVREVR